MPSVVARDLDDDPERLSLICPGLTEYVRAKAAFDSPNEDAAKAWDGSDVMLAVRKNTNDWLQRRAEARKAGG